jgi:uncharacterized protein
VFQVNKICSDIIDYYLTHSPEELHALFPHYACADIKKELAKINETAAATHAFSVDRPHHFIYEQGTPLRTLAKGSSPDLLILNVTEKCNLRCRYCVFSGIYKNRRSHSEKQMPWEIARLAINNHIMRSGSVLRFSFFGGEPLLNFRLIKKIVNYVEEKTTKKVYWSMTTNGTLLTPDIWAFLKEHDFLITVSLDGPKEIHDRYRTDRNGKGTFDKIYKNLMYLYQHDQDYYHNNILFANVCAPPFRLNEVHEFFCSDPLVRENKMSFSYMNNPIHDFFYLPVPADYQQLTIEHGQLCSDFFQALLSHDKQLSSLQRSLFERDIVRFYNRPKTDLGNSIHLNGCCFPGSRRLFVSVDGTLYLCEKEDNAYPLGNAETGIDPKAVERLIEDYQRLSRSCFTCWLCRLCPVCFIAHIKDKTLDPETRESNCQTLRKQWHALFENYYYALESDIHAFDYLGTN